MNIKEYLEKHSREVIDPRDKMRPEECYEDYFKESCSEAYYQGLNDGEAQMANRLLHLFFNGDNRV